MLLEGILKKVATFTSDYFGSVTIILSEYITDVTTEMVITLKLIRTYYFTDAEYLGLCRLFILCIYCANDSVLIDFYIINI